MAGSPEASAYKIEYYTTGAGEDVVRNSVKQDLSLWKRLAYHLVINRYLKLNGSGVCGPEPSEDYAGTDLGGGLFEFEIHITDEQIARWKELPMAASARVPLGRVLLRVYCHETADNRVLVLNAYDFGGDASPRRRDREAAVSRQRLADWETRE